MKTIAIGVYENHEKVLASVKILKENGFTDKQISIIWSKEKLDEEFEKQSKKISNTGAAEVGAGASIGVVLGVLTGVGVFAIPGVGFLFGAGALVGAIAGFDFGLIGGGLIGALSILGIKKEHHDKYYKHLKQGRYLLLVQDEEAHRAYEILLAHGQHSELDIY